MFYFEQLDVYRCAIDFLAQASQLVDCAPRGQGALTDQLRRAALSIPLNIAEGTAKRGPEARRFFTIARGSTLECAAILDAMRVLGIGEAETRDAARASLERIAAMLWKMGRKTGG